jgi:ribonucleoside-diphosphate reductase alpha chain
MNLAAYVKEGEGIFLYDEFIKDVHTAVRFLNDILEEGLKLHPLDIQKESVSKWRQIGLGIMGLADCLIEMELRYGSEEAIDFCDYLGSVMADAAIDASSKLAAEKEPFEGYNSTYIIDNDFFVNNTKKDTKFHVFVSGLRNSQLLTCAPTGSLSTMLGISGGIEPIFANYYERKTESLHGHEEWYKVYTPIVKKYMEEHNIRDDADLPNYFITAPEIAPIDRIKMQGTWQKHIDASISSTINLPNEATVEDVENIYMNAWKYGLKGVTIYRAGCKREGVLVAEPKKEESPETSLDEPISHDELKRGEVLQIEDTDAIGFKRKLVTGCGSLHCSAFFDTSTGDLVETYLSKGSTGGCNNFMVGLSRMISMSARAGVPIEVIIDQLMSTGVCPSYATRKAVKKDTSKGSCCPVAVGYALKEMWEEFNGRPLGTPPEVVKVKSKEKISKNEPKCPECGAPLIHEGGCDICKDCGYTHCD